MKKIVVIALVLVLGYWLWPAPEPEAPKPAESALRGTAAGEVIGFEDAHDTYAWLGIPFASAPTGDLRWRAPRPVQPWSEPLAATRFNNACAQLWGPLAGVEGEEGEVVGDEDCLYLNIWSPRTRSRADGDALPVMFWIHGGGNTIGTANIFDGSLLAGGENVVVVTINYRLGYFGWMSHPALRGDGASAADASGNYGTLDMIAALEWVRDNIAGFGGDPGKVTIFGESAGGRNVYSLMSSPRAAGLFHRAIAQSGRTSSTPLWRAENYRDDELPGMDSSSREWLLQQLQVAGEAVDRPGARTTLQGMPDSAIREFMYTRSPEQVLEGVQGLAGMYPCPQSIRDGAVLPQQSQLDQMRAPAQYNAVPLMTGTTRDETKLFLAQSPTYVEQRFGILPRIRDLDAYNRAAAYGTDHWKASAVDEVAAVISEHDGEPVFAYRWDWDEGATTWLVDYAKLIGAGHGMEVAFVFGSFDGSMMLPGFYNEDNVPGRDELSRQMRSYWSEFARSGDPGRGREGDLPEWRAWRNGAENLMLLDTPAGGGLRMVSEPMTVAMVKERVAADPQLGEGERCAMFAEMFLQSNAGDDFWDEAEYAALGCDDLDPWQAQVRR